MGGLHTLCLSKHPFSRCSAAWPPLAGDDVQVMPEGSWASLVLERVNQLSAADLGCLVLHDKVSAGVGVVLA